MHIKENYQIAIGFRKFALGKVDQTVNKGTQIKDSLTGMDKSAA